MKNYKKILEEIREHKNFKRYSNDARIKLNLADEVFEMRKMNSLSQSDLAKEIATTQKIISKIENGEVDIGICLLSRLSTRLNFTADNFCSVFGCPKESITFETRAPLSLCSNWAGEKKLFNKEKEFIFQ